MSRRSIRLCLILVACAVTVAVAGTAYAAGTRGTFPNDISMEMAGRCVIYSFNYQRMVGSTIGLECGLSALGGGISDNNATILFLPVGAKLYLIPKDGSIYLTGGVVPVTAEVTFHISPADGDNSTHNKWSSYSYLGLGMEYRSHNGLLFRGTAYGLIADGGFFIWPGLTVGYAF